MTAVIHHPPSRRPSRRTLNLATFEQTQSLPPVPAMPHAYQSAAGTARIKHEWQTGHTVQRAVSIQQQPSTPSSTNGSFLDLDDDSDSDGESTAPSSSFSANRTAPVSLEQMASHHSNLSAPVSPRKLKKSPASRFLRMLGLKSKPSTPSAMPRSPLGRMASIESFQPPPGVISPSARNASAGNHGVARPRKADDGSAPVHRTLGLKMRAKMVSAVGSLRKRLSSKSPQKDWPKTWSEWDDAYIRNEIDIEDPPMPPPSSLDPNTAPTPYLLKSYAPPRPLNESERQRTVNRLDLLGKFNRTAGPAASPKGQDAYFTPPASPSRTRENSTRRSSASVSSQSEIAFDSTAPTTPGSEVPASIADEAEEEASVSMKNNPVFQDIVASAMSKFGTAVAMISVLDDDQQLFLATGGLPAEMASLPRDITFCAHTVLNGQDGLVVPDTAADWRFAGSAPTAALGARFYAGYPLYAPSFDFPDNEPVAIGTLCVLDYNPRQFSIEERAELSLLATAASREVERWVASRMETKLSKLEVGFQSWKALSGPAASSPSLARMGDFPPSPPASPSRSGSRGTSSRDISSSASMTKAFNAIPVDLQTKFDAVTKLIGLTLDLGLVYLIELSISPASRTPALKLLSSYGLPVPAPSFDPMLHLRALRAAEGGLLYQNPLALELAGSPSCPSSGRIGTEANPSYASGMLIRVIEMPALMDGGRTKGYVLAGLTDQIKRVFGAEDLAYVCRFAEELERFCLAL